MTKHNADKLRQQALKQLRIGSPVDAIEVHENEFWPNVFDVRVTLSGGRYGSKSIRHIRSVKGLTKLAEDIDCD